MIRGRVNEILEAVIVVEVRGPEGVSREVEAVIDTGFSGSLTLPTSIIEELSLPWRSRGGALLANGQIDQFDVHAATAIWDGTERGVLVEAVQMEPLVGMGLLRRCRLSIDVIAGGEVRIHRRRYR